MHSNQITRLVLKSPFLRVSVLLEGRLGKRQRRAIALVLLRDISPVLRRLFDISIIHDDDHFFDRARAEIRGASLSHATRVDTAEGRLGTEIRTRRLEFGLTLKELARSSGLSIEHLSRIEKGLMCARPKTLSKIEGALSQLRDRKIAPEAQTQSSKSDWTRYGMPGSSKNTNEIQIWRTSQNRGHKRAVPRATQKQRAEDLVEKAWSQRPNKIQN